MNTPALAQTQVSNESEYAGALADPHLHITQDITLAPAPYLYKWIADPVRLEGHGGTWTLKSDGNEGQALLTWGDLTSVKQLGFEGFTRPNDMGGALSVGGSVLDGMDTVTFTNNHAEWNGGGFTVGWDFQGGLHNATFTANTADYDGGGFAVFGNLEGGVHNSQFIRNSVQYSSGAGFYVGGTVVGGIHNSTFVGNVAGGHGAALSVSDLEDGIHNSLFADNRAGEFGHGGAVYLAGWSGVGLTGGIHASRFFGNVANMGGALASNNGSVDSIADSLFIGNQAIDLGIADAFDPGGYGGAAALTGGSEIRNSVFLNNQASSKRADDHVGGTGGAILYRREEADVPSTLNIASDASGRTLFYGNTHSQAIGEAAANAIHFANVFGDGVDMKFDVTVQTSGADGTWAGRVLMFDGMSSQADDTLALGLIRGNVRTNVSKTGTNEWVLGASSLMRGDSRWDIRQGVLKLADIRYDSATPLGANAQVLLSHANSTFDLRANASLVGQGRVQANRITLNGNISPERWVNVGKTADQIDRNITALELAQIDVARDSVFGHLTLASPEVTFGSNFRYYVHIDPNAGDASQAGITHDLITVDGNLTLDANARFLINEAVNTVWTPMVDYKILEVVNGGILTDNAINLASEEEGGNVEYVDSLKQKLFLKPETRRQGSQILFRMLSTGAAFGDTDPDPEPDSVGDAIDRLDSQTPDHPVLEAIRSAASSDNIADIYRNLSGEIYASGAQVLLTDRYLRDAMNRRMQSAIHPCGDLCEKPLWLSTWGFNGHTRGKYNPEAAELAHAGMGLNMGLDRRFGQALAGVNVAYEKSRLRVGEARNARTEAQTVSVGGYAAAHLGQVQLRGGVVHSWLHLNTRRDVWVPGVQGAARAAYRGRKLQVFGEAARDVHAGERATVTPYVNVTHVWMRTGAAQETGSPAALQVAARRDQSLQTTLGLRGEYRFEPSGLVRSDDAVAGSTSILANVAWVHARNKAGKSVQRFAGTDDVFATEGIAPGRNTLLASLGVQHKPSPGSSVRLGYHGQFASGRTYHAVNLQFRQAF